MRYFFWKTDNLYLMEKKATKMTSGTHTEPNLDARVSTKMVFQYDRFSSQWILCEFCMDITVTRSVNTISWDILTQIQLRHWLYLFLARGSQFLREILVRGTSRQSAFASFHYLLHVTGILKPNPVFWLAQFTNNNNNKFYWKLKNN